jgi:hypothetical protein
VVKEIRWLIGAGAAVAVIAAAVVSPLAFIGAAIGTSIIMGCFFVAVALIMRPRPPRGASRWSLHLTHERAADPVPQTEPARHVGAAVYRPLIGPPIRVPLPIERGDGD